MPFCVRVIRLASCGLLSVLVGSLGVVASGQAGIFSAAPLDLATQVLATNDGWASSGSGTTGGAAALSENIYTVSTWAQLVSALGNRSSIAKIIKVSGTIYGDVDAGNNRRPCTDYAVAPYSEAAYIATYDPAVWGTKAPSGALETARAASARAQAPAIQLQVGSNTTIVGLGSDATLQDVNLILSTGASNVIIRNITFKDAFDCFPQWSPTDRNPQTPPYLAANNYLPGNFNSAYDNVSLTGARNVWIDHCVFTDEPDTEDVLPVYYGRPYQVHDGELDIGSASDLVTVSWNVFKNHGKTSLVGSSDSATGDAGHLRTTFHHNLYTNLEERQPRDRYGALDVYNNFYAISNPSYVYSWGVGNKSMIFAENNAFITTGPQANMTVDRIVYPWTGGTAICIAGTLFNNPDTTADVLPAVNAATALWSPPAQTLSPDCGFNPTLRSANADAAQDVPALVLSGAVAQPSLGSPPAFAPVVVGQTQTAHITLANDGSGVLLVNDVKATGDFAVVPNACAGTVAAHSTCQIAVKFTPATDGTRTGTLSVSDWAKTTPQILTLSAVGVLEGAVQLTTTAVLSKTGGNYRAVVTVTNTGNGTAQDVVLDAASLGSATGQMLPASLGALAHSGGSASVTLTFPLTAGTSGSIAVERFSGRYRGGSFGGSLRTTLP